MTHDAGYSYSPERLLIMVAKVNIRGISLGVQKVEKEHKTTANDQQERHHRNMGLGKTAA